jgi:hypothetical protein
MKSSVFWNTMPCSPLKINILEEHVTSIFTVGDQAKQETSIKQQAALFPL